MLWDLSFAVLHQQYTHLLAGAQRGDGVQLLDLAAAQHFTCLGGGWLCRIANCSWSANSGLE